MIETDLLVVGSGPAGFSVAKPDFATFWGSPGDARVLDGQESPIRVLPAAGNDMIRVMSGTYPGPGIAIGPALAIGYIAAGHVAGLDGPAGS